MDSFAVPKAVTNLTVADVNTTAVCLTWHRQDDHKSEYSYEVTVLGKDKKQQFNTTTEQYTVIHLTPGVNYTFQVSTVVQEVKSTEETTSSYTGMSLKLPLSSSCRLCHRFIVTACTGRLTQIQRLD